MMRPANMSAASRCTASNGSALRRSAGRTPLRAAEQAEGQSEGGDQGRGQSLSWLGAMVRATVRVSIGVRSRSDWFGGYLPAT